MEIVLALSVVVLSFGLLVLFAMLGEMNARVERLASAGSTSQRPVEESPMLSARVGHTPEWYPTGLEFPDGRTMVLVVSTVCTSCAGLVQEMSDKGAFGDLLVLVVCRTETAGWDFIAEHNIEANARGVYLDLTGFWLLEEFNIASSPSVLVFEGSELREGYNVTSFGQLARFAGLEASQ